METCECNCGTPVSPGKRFIRGHNARVIPNALKHGQSYRPEYTAYRDAQYRCENPRVKSFATYGARGIRFLFESFDAFIAELGPRPTPAHQLGRKNTAGNYERGNVGWFTRKEQCKNRRPYPRPWLQSKNRAVLLLH